MDHDISIYGILYNCPTGKRRTDCPLAKVGHLSFQAKLNWLEKHSQEKKDLILKHHLECSAKKKNKNFALLHQCYAQR